MVLLLFSIRFASDTPRFSPDYFAMADHSVVYDPSAFTDIQNVEIRAAFVQLSEFIDISFGQVNEANTKLSSIRFLLTA